MTTLDSLTEELRARGFDVLNDVGPGAIRVVSDPYPLDDDLSVLQFSVTITKDSCSWTVDEPNGMHLRLRYPKHVVELVLRLRAIRREERLERAPEDEAPSAPTEADVQKRKFPCPRCKQPFRFRSLPRQVRSALMDINLRAPIDGPRKPSLLRGVREIRKGTGCSVADAKHLYDHVGLLSGSHPLEREYLCHQCHAPFEEGGDFRDCNQCGALNLLL